MSNEKFRKLYFLMSEFAATLGSEGEVELNAHQPFNFELVAALEEIDNGMPGDFPGPEDVSLEIYELGLHESVVVDGSQITRVPGGWIYSSCIYGMNGEPALSECFVPYDEEFHPDAA